MNKNSFAAFTLIEMLVVISIIVVLAAFAGPALFSALTKGQMTASVNNAHQLYLVGQQMALDGSTNSDPTRAWPGDLTDTTSSSSGGGAAAPITTLQQYATKLVQGDYLKAADLQKLLSAPGTTCTATVDANSNVTLGGKSGLKIYRVTETDATNTIFAATANYTYNTPLAATDAPYGDKGFVVHRKGGDSAVLKKNNATTTSGQETAFQSIVGKRPGDADGMAGVSAGDNSKALENPK
jgi:prepilin-type N-terminal cleavage/methylation domain-containing protein